MRKPGEGLVDTWAGMTLNTDGSVHLIRLKQMGEVGDPQAIADLLEVANDTSHPDRVKDAVLATRILNYLAANHKQVLLDYRDSLKGSA
jgi:hypothetical protein